MTYSKKIIEIADIIFANPTKEVSVIVSEIVSRSHKSERTVWRWVKKAQEYNLTRIQKQEKIKDDIMVTQTKKEFSEAILTRSEAKKILSEIARGNKREVDEEILIPSDSDRIRALAELGKMEGWNEPNKTIISGNLDIKKNLENLTDEELKKIINGEIE